MRPKVVATVLIVAFTLLAALFLIPKFFRPPSSPLAAENAGGPAVLPNSSPTNDPSEAPHRPVISPPVPAAPPDPAQAKYVSDRVTELEKLAMRNDSAARDEILSELQNSNRTVRHAALEAAIQFGDRSVVPRLQEVAAQTEDSAEKSEILEAIDYINLPSLTEYLAAQREPAGTTQPRSATNRLTRRLRVPAPTPAPNNP
jgi:hypothetical protein